MTKVIADAIYGDADEILPTNYKRFKAEFQNNLFILVENHHEMYAYTVDEVPAVVHRMMPHFGTGGCNINSPAIKATCKSLGIRHTIKAIKEFVNA